MQQKPLRLAAQVTGGTYGISLLNNIQHVACQLQSDPNGAPGFVRIYEMY